MRLFIYLMMLNSLVGCVSMIKDPRLRHSFCVSEMVNSGQADTTRAVRDCGVIHRRDFKPEWILKETK